MDIEYFLDKLQWYEVNSYLSNIKYLDSNSWEQTRLLLYAVSSIFSKKHLKLQDCLKFPWEQEEHNTEISNEDIERLKKQAEIIKQKNYGNK